MKDYRRLTEDEILQLKSQSCLADYWGNVSVAEGFMYGNLDKRQGLCYKK